RNFTRGLLRYSEWHLAYAHTKVPSTGVKLGQGTLAAQFTAATRAFGSQEIVVRFGASVEGGNRQTDLDQRSAPLTELGRTGYGAMKAFVGTSLVFGRHRFKSSYGLQLGKSGEGFRVDYAKQIFDTALDLQFVPRNHRPIAIESRFTAGLIHVPGKVPVAERFFGGEHEEKFIFGDAWAIRRHPLLRSFSQSRFVPSRKTGAMIGGDRFFSINITVAPTVWGYPLVPKQIINDAGFDGALKTGLSIAQGALRNRILGDTKEFKEVAALVLELPPVVRQLKDELKKIPSPNPNAQIEAQLKKLFKPAPSPDQKPSGAFDRVELLSANIAHSLDPQ